MSIDIDSLNGPQREAVVTVDGPLLVLAGAGSGKTRVLTYRIANLIENHDVAPWEILAITFTNKAAAEMRERLNGLVGPRCRGMWVSTFHSMCVRMLRSDAEKLGFTRNFTIYDTDDQKRLYKEIMAELDIDPKRFPVNALMNRISTAKNELVVPSAFEKEAGDPVGKVASRVYSRLQERLKAANAFDFDDLLLYAYLLLKNHEDVRSAYQQRFRYIMVDEYQDTNHAQYSITGLLAEGHKNIMVVGDDDQSIYSWRGADLRNILEFEQDYPTAHTVKLEQNYRSVGNVLAAANAVIANNQHRKAKKLFTSAEDGDKIQVYMAADERDEGRWIAGEIEKQRAAGLSYNQVAVFYRTNAQSRMLEDMLLRAGVPYRIVGGTRFFDRAEIRDVMAYLTLVVNPADDIAAKRVINVPRRGIGKTTIERIEQFAREMGMTFMEAARVGAPGHRGVRGPRQRGAHLRRRFAQGHRDDHRQERPHRRAAGREHRRGARPHREHPGVPRRRRRVHRNPRGRGRSVRGSHGRAGRRPRARPRPLVRRRPRGFVLRLRGRERACGSGRGEPRARPARRLAGRLHRVGAPAHRPRHGGRGRPCRHHDDRALVERPRVRLRVRGRHGGDAVPPHEQRGRCGRHRGGASSRVRGHHARPQEAVPHLRLRAPDLRPDIVEPHLALHPGDPLRAAPAAAPRRAAAACSAAPARRVRPAAATSAPRAWAVPTCARAPRRRPPRR